MKLKSAWAAIYKAERVVKRFIEGVCNGHSFLLHVQVSSYQDPLNVVLRDAQAREEYFGSYLIRVGDGGYGIPIDETDRDEECGGCSPLRKTTVISLRFFPADFSQHTV